MKLNRRSFIKRTLTTLAAFAAAALRGDGTAKKKRYYGYDATMEIDGVTFSNPSITRLPDKWGISSSAVAERIRELSASGEFILIPSDDCEVSVVRWNGKAWGAGEFIPPPAADVLAPYLIGNLIASDEFIPRWKGEAWVAMEQS